MARLAAEFARSSSSAACLILFASSSSIPRATKSVAASRWTAASSKSACAEARSVGGFKSRILLQSSLIDKRAIPTAPRHSLSSSSEGFLLPLNISAENSSIALLKLDVISAIANAYSISAVPSPNVGVAVGMRRVSVTVGSTRVLVGLAVIVGVEDTVGVGVAEDIDVGFDVSEGVGVRVDVGTIARVNVSVGIGELTTAIAVADTGALDIDTIIRQPQT